MLTNYGSSYSEYEFWRGKNASDLGTVKNEMNAQYGIQKMQKEKQDHTALEHVYTMCIWQEKSWSVGEGKHF